MFGGLVSNAKFQCLGMSWGCCDNGLKERQRRQLRRGEREKTLIFYLVTQTFTRNSGWAENSVRAVKFFKGKIVFLLFGEVSNI